MSGSAVDRARVGDGEGWRELYAAHAARLVVWLRTSESGDVAASAEDLAAEAWLVAAEKIGSFRGGDDDFAGWLFGIARNVAANARRRTRRRNTRATDPHHGSLDRLAPHPGVPGHLDRVRGLLDQLPTREREVVACLEVVGLDVAATAAALGISQAAVRVARHRGLSRLRRGQPALATT
ncbi:RNA polymerase sigma factor [uncultured Nocardioides sp.]|uniref:RNA polymerase sigma factor n=1 Tax=uncultured Nocardioides sp. TaxID=198441 RepID=UPI0025E3C7DB|nr:sigma-70 family RNA polymerase sigma factor [uncultured Nocardioides sp.]